MSVNVQSMLDELREEMSSFEGSLPEISDRDALDGLLGIKHVLREKWEARDESPQPKSSNGGEALPVFVFVFVALVGVVATISGLRSGNVTGTVVGGVTTAAIAAIAGIWWIREHHIRKEAVNASTNIYEERNHRLGSDPVFLIDEVRSYVQEQIDIAHGRFSEIRMQFEKAVMYPRAKAETALVTLRERRQDAQSRQFPDEDQILAQIDKYIAECERLLNPSFDEERVAKQLRDTGEQLQALYKYPTQLEQVKAAYQSQADFVADLDDVGVDIDGIQSSRSTTMMAVASQPGPTRGDRPHQQAPGGVRGLPGRTA